MPRIAAGLVDVYFQQNYKRGAIVRFYMECDDPKRTHRNKFGIVLNKDTTEADALLAITTTNFGAFAHGRSENDILRIVANAYPCFDQDTIVSLREIHIEPVVNLKRLGEVGLVTFQGAVSPDDMALIEQKVIASKLIERHFKKRIL